MNLANAHKIAMLGIGGAGMKGLALLLAARGIEVIGVDRNATDTGIIPEAGAEDVVTSVDMVIHTDAMDMRHSLLQRAQAAGIPILIYHEALGELTRAKRTIAITGTHGKSSTTSMLAHIFEEGGLDPSALVGAPIPRWHNANARVGESDFFIVEADEYRNHYLSLAVESAIITTIDFDHPDFFSSLAAVEESFGRFVANVSKAGILVVPANLPQMFTHIPWPAHTRLVSAPPTPIDLILPGTHMQYNAWLAIQMALHYGIDEAAARQALATWPGLSRRFERLGSFRGIEIISDYGHHPREIAATLAAARERYPTQRIGVIFEAHTQERLRRFNAEFGSALALADGVVIAPVFLPVGREHIRADVADLVGKLSAQIEATGRPVVHVSQLSQLKHMVSSLANQFDIILAFSAGNVDQTLRSFVTAE